MTTGDSLRALVDRAQLARTSCREARAAAALVRHRVMAAGRLTGRGVLPIAVADGTVCAVDGDDTTLCTGSAAGEKLVGYDWFDVPADQKCPICGLVLLGVRAPDGRGGGRVHRGSRGEAAASARRAFDHAVAAERRAIAVHEHAALMHHDVASRLDAFAGAARGAGAAHELTRRAAAERRLAAGASERADGVRRRLSAEGVDEATE